MQVQVVRLRHPIIIIFQIHCIEIFSKLWNILLVQHLHDDYELLRFVKLQRLQLPCVHTPAGKTEEPALWFQNKWTTNGPARQRRPRVLSSNCINVGIFMYTLLWTYGMVIVAVTVCNDLDRQTKWYKKVVFRQIRCNTAAFITLIMDRYVCTQQAALKDIYSDHRS